MILIVILLSNRSQKPDLKATPFGYYDGILLQRVEELKHVAEEEEVSSIMSPDWYPRCRQAGFACQYLGQYWSHEPESSHNPDRNTPVYLITSNDLPETSCLSSRGVVLDTASEGPDSLFVPIVTRFVPIVTKS